MVERDDNKYPNRVIPQRKNRVEHGCQGWKMFALGSSRMIYYGILCNNNLLRSKSLYL